MEIIHLDKMSLYKALAKECNWDHDDADCWHETIGIGCPFSASEDENTVNCNEITADHWREVFEGKDEPEPMPDPEPEFRFGDRVTAEGRKGIFVRYIDEELFAAFVVFENTVYLPECETSILKAGWE